MCRSICFQPMCELIVGSCRWATLTGRLRAQRMLGRVKQLRSRSSSVNDPALPNGVKTVTGETSASNRVEKLKERASRVLESSLYALCGRTRFQLGPSTALSCTSELDTLSRQAVPGPLDKTRVPWRGSVSLHHKVFQHLTIYIKVNFWIATSVCKFSSEVILSLVVLLFSGINTNFFWKLPTMSA
jgi:hypothetical protein